jgi:hypothetical protein
MLPLSNMSYTPAVRMAPAMEKAKCVLWFHEHRSAVTVQRRFHRQTATKMSITIEIN